MYAAAAPLWFDCSCLTNNVLVPIIESEYYCMRAATSHIKRSDGTSLD